VRIWTVPFEELDDQRVLAQHHEIHMAHSLIVGRGRPWGGLTAEDHSYINRVHDLAVVEMTIRGFNGHQTPLPGYDSGFYRAEIVDRATKQMHIDRWHLVLRWGGVFKGRTCDPVARREYGELIERYTTQGGCLHDGSVEKGEGKHKGVALCLLCKQATRAQVWLPSEQRYETGPWEAGGWSRNDVN